jgi:DNA repair exonuclease SbcCD nuclease subunit
MIRFVHTANLQIGKPFNWADPRRARPALQEAREEVITQIGEVADERGACFILVAGDLFDDNTVGDVVTRTCHRLANDVPVPVYILPGNHDFSGGPSCVYHRSPFKPLKPDHVIVLDQREPYVVGERGEASPEEEVLILPAPVQRRNERGDPTGHIDADFGRDSAPDALRVGLAHGGVEAFGGGEAASRIDPERANRAELDYLALGDWHGYKEVNPKTWYSGTPEPDRFKQNNPGYVLSVEIDSSGSLPTVEPVRTGQFEWQRTEMSLQAEEDLDALEHSLNDIDDPLHTLVRLELSGVLGLDTQNRLTEMTERMGNTVLAVRDRGNVRPKATEDEIEAMAGDGYLGETVESLRRISESEDEDADVADRALQLLYRFHRSESQ